MTNSSRRLGLDDERDVPLMTGRQPPAGDGAVPFLEFVDVSKSYDGETRAVAGLNCSVQQGEFLTFLGPSGSGKTTALMMLAGFEALSGGDIRIRGNSIARTPPHKRDMGVVFQNYALFPHMNVAENVAFPLRARRVEKPAIRAKVDAALRLVRLSGLEQRRPSQLSGGQQQRVALARALVFDPVLVLMDEPLGALDRQLREQLQFEIKTIQSRLGLTVIYVTHDQQEALTMSNRIAVFQSGSVQQLGTPEDLYERPETAFVAGFVGENNRLKAVIVSTEGDRCVVRTDGGRIVRATLVGHGGAGTRATLSIRPEKIVLNPQGDERQNMFEAQTEARIYQGSDIQLRVALPGDGHALVRLPTTIAGLETGQPVMVGWRAADCRAYAGIASIVTAGQPLGDL